MSRTITRAIGAAAIVIATVAATTAPTQATPAAPRGGGGPPLNSYTPITPCRVLDTRSGGGGELAANAQRDYQLAGDGPAFATQGGQPDGCGIPFGVSAVEASITAVTPKANGYFRAWPKGSAAPNATFLNYTRNQGTTNTGTIAINSRDVKLSGADLTDLTVKNFGGPSDYVIDIQGYYGRGQVVRDHDPDGMFVPLRPCRVLDTRNGGGGRFAPGDERSYKVTDPAPPAVNEQVSTANFSDQGGNDDGCGIPAEALAVEASVSAVAPSGKGFFRAWPANEGQPNATILNFAKSRGTTNTGTIKLAPFKPKAIGDDITVRNFSGSTDYVIDVQGYFMDRFVWEQKTERAVNDDPAEYAAIVPCRILDTRNGGGGLFANQDQRSIQVAGSGPAFSAQGGRAGGCDIPGGASGVEASITAVTPQGTGFLRAWPANTAPPQATVLNFTGGEATTNTGSLALDFATAEALTLRNFSGSTHYVIDIQGYFLT